MAFIDTLGGIRKMDVEKYLANPPKYPQTPSRHPPESRVIGRDDLPTKPSDYRKPPPKSNNRLKRQLPGPLPKNYDWRQHTMC